MTKMTVRELISELSEVDEDILDYTVWIITTIQISKEVRISSRTPISKVEENVDVGGQRLFLKASSNETH